MQVWVIDDNIKADIKRVMDYAEKHERSIDQFFVPGDLKEFTCLIPIGYKVVFSIDVDSKGDKFRHLSISLGDGKKLPSIPVALSIAKEFGFLAENITDFYDINIENDFAVNMIELIKENNGN